MKNVVFSNSIEFDCFVHNNCDKCAKHSYCRYLACDVFNKLVQGIDLDNETAKEYFGGPVNSESKCLKIEPAENYIYRNIPAIIYKGYSPELKEWVEGFLLVSEDGVYVVNTDIVWLQEHKFPGLEKRFKVDADSIGQRTLFLDKNGKELFAGDVVEIDYVGEADFYPSDDEVEIKGKYMVDVVYPYGVRFVSLKKVNGYRDIVEARFMRSESVEFVGNVYDNRLQERRQDV